MCHLQSWVTGEKVDVGKLRLSLDRVGRWQDSPGYPTTEPHFTPSLTLSLHQPPRMSPSSHNSFFSHIQQPETLRTARIWNSDLQPHPPHTHTHPTFHLVLFQALLHDLHSRGSSGPSVCYTKMPLTSLSRPFSSLITRIWNKAPSHIHPPSSHAPWESHWLSIVTLGPSLPVLPRPQSTLPSSWSLRDADPAVRASGWDLCPHFCPLFSSLFLKSLFDSSTNPSRLCSFTSFSES